MPKAIRIDETGGTEVMQWVDVEPGAPGEGEEMEMEALMKSMQFERSKPSPEGSQDG